MRRLNDVLELSQLAGYNLYGKEEVPAGGIVTGIINYECCKAKNRISSPAPDSFIKDTLKITFFDLKRMKIVKIYTDFFSNRDFFYKKNFFTSVVIRNEPERSWSRSRSHNSSFRLRLLLRKTVNYLYFFFLFSKT
jgi:hypothetical protein